MNGETTLFVYCKSGKLIAEADSDGNVLKEYVYLEGDIFAHFQYEVPAPAPPEAASSAEPSQAAAPEPVADEQETVPPAVAETSTPSDTAFLPAIYLLLLMNDKSADGAYYYITDHLGAPQMITDDSGRIVWQAAYLPFGNVNILTADIENNLRFPGQHYDAETGLHYNWNRYYNPETGRYIAADPIGLDGGINLYAYVEGDPVNGVDLEGLSTVDTYCKRYPTSCGKLMKDGTIPVPIPAVPPQNDPLKDTIPLVVQPEKPAECEKPPNHCLVACIRCFAKETRWWERGPACIYCAACTLAGGFNSD